MDESDQIELAKAYVARSNTHRLELIVPLFTINATYHSPHVGEFKGKDSIGQMMADFFSRFPDAHWKARSYRCKGLRAIEFEFVMNATEAQSGNSIERSGVESIEFTLEGLISRLEVSNT